MPALWIHIKISAAQWRSFSEMIGKACIIFDTNRSPIPAREFLEGISQIMAASDKEKKFSNRSSRVLSKNVRINKAVIHLFTSDVLYCL